MLDEGRIMLKDVISVSLISCLSMLVSSVKGEDQLVQGTQGPFKPDVTSLRKFQCPDWFKEAKLGFWAHWGPQAQGAMGDKYARGMYVQGHPQYEAHVQKYGHPSKVGYKDVIESWEAEKFTPRYADFLMKLYKRAGASFFVAMAHHHDNFDMWDSKHHLWDVVKKGPRKNVMAIWEKATRENGLRFGVTSHVASAPEFFEAARESDKTGPLAGVPYDGADPRNSELYCPSNWENDDFNWPLRWYNRLKDVVDQHRPDILYFDGGVPYFETYGKALLAHYYNQNASDHGGHREGLVLSKRIEENRGFTVWDFEFSVILDKLPEPWVADMFLGHWYWNADYETGPIPYSDPDFLIDFLIDVASKNGRLMMNIPQRADGTVHDAVIHSLEEMADWMAVNGESILGTIPWKVFGEGPSALHHGVEEDLRRKGESKAHFYYFKGYGREHVRFMQSPDGETFYVIVLGWPQTYANGWPGHRMQLAIRSMQIDDTAPDARVELLGSEEPISYKIDDQKRLVISIPELRHEERPSKYAFAFRLNGFEISLSREGAAKRPIR